MPFFEHFRRPRMVLKNVGIAVICATLLAWNSPSLADEYRPDEFLSLDLSKALLSQKPRGAVRTKLARRHGNPLDAQAFDPRIQVWPCKSGGICNWKR